MRIAPWQISNRTEYAAFYAQDQLPEAAAYDLACAVMVGNAQADDAHEGMRAFLEKRAAEWRNR